MYILDTNTLIYYFKGQGNVAKNMAHVSPSEIGISTIVFFELQVGIAKSNSPAKRTQQLEQLLSRVNLVFFRARLCYCGGENSRSIGATR